MLYGIQDLSRRHLQGDATIRALDGITFSLAQGERVAIAGPSGCGKTTLLHVLALLDTGFEGEVRFQGCDIRALSRRERTRLRLSDIGLVFQQGLLLPALDVLDNVALPHWRLHGDRKNARILAQKRLHALGLGDRLHHAPGRLSGGETQRAAVARALMNEPALLLADEPTGNLDSVSAEAVLSLFSAAAERGTTVVIVTHDPDVVATADRVLRLRDGQLLPPATGAS